MSVASAGGKAAHFLRDVDGDRLRNSAHASLDRHQLQMQVNLWRATFNNVHISELFCSSGQDAVQWSPRFYMYLWHDFRDCQRAVVEDLPVMSSGFIRTFRSPGVIFRPSTARVLIWAPCLRDTNDARSAHAPEICNVAPHMLRAATGATPHQQNGARCFFTPTEVRSWHLLVENCRSTLCTPL